MYQVNHVYINITSLAAKNVPCNRKLDYQDQTEIIQCEKHQRQCILERHETIPIIAASVN